MRSSCTTKCCKDVEAPGLEISKCISAGQIKVACDTGNAAKDCKGREVGIWPLSLPCSDETVYFVAMLIVIGHAGRLASVWKVRR